MSTSLAATTVFGRREVELPRVCWRPVLAVSSALVAVLLLLSGQYGYHLDELYFRVAGRHLDWGYVDQPVLLPLLARSQIELFGDHLGAIRVAPALMAGLVTVVAALITRELGGGGSAQTLAALATAVSVGPLVDGHLLYTSTVNHIAWVTICWLFLRLLRTRDARLWLAIGAVAGVGMLGKYLVVLLVIGLGVAIVVSESRRLLLSWYSLAGAGLALLIAAPSLLWQLVHGWPQFAVADSLAELPGARVSIVPLQVVAIGPFLTPLWIAGLIGFLRRPDWRPYRPVGVAYLVIVALLLVVGGNFAYTVGILIVLLAAGCVLVTDWARTTTRRIWTGAAVAANAILAVVMALPVLPLGWYTQNPALMVLGGSQFYQYGWPQLAEQVAEIHRSLPVEDRANTVILAGTFDEASALAKFGSAHNLPQEYSGHNSYADFGVPADDKNVVIALNMSPALLSDLFGHCEERSRLDFELPQKLQNAPIAVCRDPLGPWSELWPRVRWIGVT